MMVTTLNPLVTGSSPVRVIKKKNERGGIVHPVLLFFLAHLAVSTVEFALYLRVSTKIGVPIRGTSHAAYARNERIGWPTIRNARRSASHRMRSISRVRNSPLRYSSFPSHQT